MAGHSVTTPRQVGSFAIVSQRLVHFLYSVRQRTLRSPCDQMHNRRAAARSGLDLNREAEAYLQARTSRLLCLACAF